MIFVVGQTCVAPGPQGQATRIGTLYCAQLIASIRSNTEKRVRNLHYRLPKYRVIVAAELTRRTAAHLAKGDAFWIGNPPRHLGGYQLESDIAAFRRTLISGFHQGHCS